MHLSLIPKSLNTRKLKIGDIKVCMFLLLRKGRGLAFPTDQVPSIQNQHLSLFSIFDFHRARLMVDKEVIEIIYTKV